MHRAPVAAAAPPQPASESLDRPLALARHLVAGIDSFARSLHSLPPAGAALSLSLGLLDGIELPPDVRSEADLAQLQAVAALYLAAELEAAGLLPAVELLAGLFVSGGLRLEDRPTAAALHAFWQRRNERFAAEERRAIFARLFGAQSAEPAPAAFPALPGQAATPALPITLALALPAAGSSANVEFELLLLALADALLRTEPAPGYPAGAPPQHAPLVSLAALSAASAALVENLLPRSGGIVAFAAREITAAVSEALEIVKSRALQAALGVNGAWAAVQAALGQYRNVTVRVTPHLLRAKSGLLLLTWLAEDATRSGDGTAGALTLPPPPVLAAAAAWLRATADLQDLP